MQHDLHNIGHLLTLTLGKQLKLTFQVELLPTYVV